MHFKKLEIFGFKSFADKTILNFEPGITAIVGPNGCGKSNVFDAIRWVLGEQSTKDLRGSSMEDVIFNGTAQKASLGFAEVSLTFANDSRMLPIEYDEVTMTRRLFRSGESEYLLNKTVVRLRDIQELLMGTGIGAEAYSLVQQGKVDLVVSARPEDRRMIFDEASGITKYKVKKKEALNKLKDTENNLLRINDIIVEVKRQIVSIERQADKARKYKEEFEKLEKLEVQWTQYQLNALGHERATVGARMEELKGEEQEISRQLEEHADQLTGRTDLWEELEDKINGLHAEEIRLEGQIDLNNRHIGFNQERIAGIDGHNQKLKEQKEHLIARCRTQQEKIEELKEGVAFVQETLQSRQQNLKEKRVLLSRMEGSVQEAKDKIVENEERILPLTSQQVSVRNELTDVMKEIQGALARKRRLEIEREKVGVEVDGLKHKLQNLDAEIHCLEGIIHQLEGDRENQGALLDRLRGEMAGLSQRIDELEKKGLFYKSQKDFIEKLNVQYQDIPDPVVEGRLITQTQPLNHHTGIIGKVKEVHATGSGKFEFLKNILAKNDVQQLYEIVCETKFIELDPQQISRKIEEISLEIDQLSTEKDAYIAKIEDEAKLYKDIQQNIHGQEKVFSVFNAQHNDLLEKSHQLQEELELIASELGEVEAALSAVKKREEELNYRLDTVSQDMEWCQNDIKNKQAWIAAKSQEKEEITVSIAQMEAERESQKDKLKTSYEHLEMFSKDLDSWLEEIKRIDDEIASSEGRKAQAALENQALMEKIEDVRRGQERLKGALADYECQKQDLVQCIGSLRSGIAGLEEGRNRVQQLLHDQELKGQELTFKEKGLKDRLQQTYRINLDDVVVPPPSPGGAAARGEETPEAWNEEEILREIERLRRRCDSFGSVNLVAIEECEELKGRFEFLTKQQSDLLEAKSQLMTTISKINRSTHQMFMDTFTKVGEEFRVYFRMLFGGGEAQLVLLDPENVLESGIDIIARPPGKKLQNISLLSGGEKTLTAIALIFGVFRVKPSPFCVLDEIDAALDDSNVGRFSYLLKEFAKIAQFIVITHNKKTIASADIMYGITMPETGVSRIVSVKFSGEKKNEEEAVLVEA